MSRLSIITAAYAPAARYLAQTIASVRDQVLPPGWRLEWLVQEDGTRPDLAGWFHDVPQARYEAHGARLGLAATRNLALSRATGELVQVLDHDDVLLPGALATVGAAFSAAARPSAMIHWAVGQADDLLPDGTRRPYPAALPYGLVPAGAVNDWAAAHEGRCPIHCAGLMMRTESLRAVGGWSGIPVDDDLAMFAALSELTAGVNVAAATWLYRLHPYQTHRTAAWRAHGATGRRIASQRAAAIRYTGLRLATSSGQSVTFRSACAVLGSTVET